MFKIDEDLIKASNLWSIDENKRLTFNYKDDILNEYKALFSRVFENINTDESTPQGQIITALTQTDLASISYLENLGNAFFFGGSGEFLDRWAWNLFRVTRKKASPANALIKIEGVGGTKIDKDFTITDGETNYKIQNETIIGDNGSVEALFYATEINDKIANKGTISEIVTIINGVERVSNLNASNPAIFEESDTALFNRCVYFGSTAKNATFRSIMANVGEVEGVDKLAGAENVTDEPLEVSGVTLSPHSIALVVNGGKNEDIAEAILNSRATGCDMNGDVEVSLNIDTQKYTYKFYRPTLIPLKIKVKVSSVGGLIESNYKEIVKRALLDFINALDINAKITQPLIANSLIRGVNNLNILEVSYNTKSGGDFGYEPLQLKLNEMASLAEEDIQVEEVKGV